MLREETNKPHLNSTDHLLDVFLKNSAYVNALELDDQSESFLNHEFDEVEVVDEEIEITNVRKLHVVGWCCCATDSGLNSCYLVTYLAFEGFASRDVHASRSSLRKPSPTAGAHDLARNDASRHTCRWGTL
jgi:hypothetical protein